MRPRVTADDNCQSPPRPTACCSSGPDPPRSCDGPPLGVSGWGVPKAGPTTLLGRWTSTMTCDAGQPCVELRRKLATYGTLTVTSHPTTGWAWSFERAEKWFANESVTTGDDLDTLSAAIEAGVPGAMALVREACSFHDTRRRAADDPTYAAKHAVSPRRGAHSSRRGEARPHRPAACVWRAAQSISVRESSDGTRGWRPHDRTTPVRREGPSRRPERSGCRRPASRAPAR